MDFAKVTDSILALVKSAVPENTDTSQYKDIPALDAQRDIIVSHLKYSYESGTAEQSNAKEFADTANTYKNMTRVSEGESEKITRKIKELTAKIEENKSEVEKGLRVRRILQILLATTFVTLLVYVVAGSFRFVHAIAFVVLLAGIMVVLYTRGEKIEWSFTTPK